MTFNSGGGGWDVKEVGREWMTAVSVSLRRKVILAIYGPMIYTAPYVMVDF
jgi:hypothetical protein